MNKKEVLATATFLVLYTGFIFAGFNWMLTTKMKAEIAPVKAEMTAIKENQVRLEKRMDRRMDRIESMLGQILIAQNTHHKHRANPPDKFKKTSKTKSANRKTASH